MAPHVSQNLSRIKQFATELNKLADEATEQIRALGKFLEELSPGIEVTDDRYFHHGREENSSGRTKEAHYSLSYGRDDNGKFGLNVIATVQRTDEDGKPLVEYDSFNNEEPDLEGIWTARLDQQSRQMRIAAIERLPGFIETISKELETTVTAVKGNLEKVRGSLAELKEALGETPPKPNFAADLRKTIRSLREAAEIEMSPE